MNVDVNGGTRAAPSFAPAVTTSPPAARPGTTRAPDADVVTAGLQQLFASIADEPIPEDFLRLLDEIDAGAARAPTVGSA